MPASLNDEDLEILADKLLAKMLLRLARRAQDASMDTVVPPPPPPSAAPAKFKKRTVPHRKLQPTPADYEFAARWASKRKHKE